MAEMTMRPFKQVDVFTTRPCYGNPVAVILNAEGLSGSQMQRVANWTNLSETIFISADPEVEYHLRIFTPQSELPFAGHPTIGSAHAAIEAGLVSADKPFRLRCGLGVLNLRVEQERIWVRVPPPKPVASGITTEALKPALNGLETRDPLVFDTGPVWMVARADDVQSLVQLQVNQPELADLSRSEPATTGLILYAHRDEGGIEVRAFAPAEGVAEDPVCGSGNISAAAHLLATGGLEQTGNRYEASQGQVLGRDGRLSLAVGPDYFELGGQAVTVIEGQIRV